MNCYRCTTPIPDESRYCLSCGAAVSDPKNLTHTFLTDAGVAALVRVLREETGGEYEIHRELGRGGMAVVYLATEVHLARKVAIKVLPPELTLGPEAIERFRREARTAASLDHPNIIPIYRVSSASRLFWYAMKFIEGRSLQQHLDEKGRLSLRESLEFLRPIGDALDYAHARQIVHRDIKPSNVMLDERGWMTIADFGIAKELAGGSLTSAGAWMGSPSHMSPEQCAGTPVSGATDQYAAGVMAYQMLSGSLPFETDSVLALLQAHRYDAPISLRERVPGLSNSAYEAIDRALAKESKARFPTVSAFVGALATAVEEMERPSQSEPPRVAKRYDPSVPPQTPRKPLVRAPQPTPREEATPQSPHSAVRTPKPLWSKKAISAMVAVLVLAAGANVVITYWRDSQQPASSATEPASSPQPIGQPLAEPTKAQSAPENEPPVQRSERRELAGSKTSTAVRGTPANAGGGTATPASSGSQVPRDTQTMPPQSKAADPPAATRQNRTPPESALVPMQKSQPNVAAAQPAILPANSSGTPAPPTFASLAEGEMARVKRWFTTVDSASVRRVFGAQEAARIWRSLSGRTTTSADAKLLESSAADSSATFFLIITDYALNRVVFSAGYRATFVGIPGGVRLFTVAPERP